MFGLHTLSRLNVETDGAIHGIDATNVLSTGCTKGLDYIMGVITKRCNPEPKINDNYLECNYLLFLFHALYNITSDASGRNELFNTRDADSKFPGEFFPTCRHVIYIYIYIYI